MHVLVTIHTVAAVVAIACGIFILVLQKGTHRHRMLGRIYVVSILVMVILSFFIRHIRIDQFSIFHLISIQVTSFVAVGLGALVLRSRIRTWYVWHARFMLYSYVTLIVTGTAQAFDYLPFGSDILNAVVFVQVPAVAGWVLIEFVGMPGWRRLFAAGSASAAMHDTPSIDSLRD